MSASEALSDDPVRFLRRALRRRGPQELETIARTKRFWERLSGDAAFRNALRSGSAADAVLYERYRPIWDNAFGRTIWDSPEELARWPDVALWKAWQGDLERYRDLMTAYPAHHGIDPRFQAWRRRQVARTASELGPMHKAITHPVAAYELARGCSVGCWFCGVSAPALQEAADHARDGALWRGMLGAMAERLGPAARTGFCYWASDPADTPDYDRFLADHRDATGWVPQTTTAAALKDLALTRRVLALSTDEEPVLNRFSVLTLRQLEEIFETFTARELLLVDILPQMKGSLKPKARAGRALARQAARPESELGLSGIATTIACVSGFLVNLPERRLRLVAPCRADAAHPLGYRTLDERRFDDADGFADALDAMIATHMPEDLPADRPIRLRGDLSVAMAGDALQLRNDVAARELRGFPFLPRLASLLGGEPRPAAAMIEVLVAEGANIFDVHAALSSLYDDGLVETARVDAPQQIRALAS